MRYRTSILLSGLALLVALAGLPAAAQTATSGSDRSFLSFLEESTVVDGQWWEGRLELVDDDDIDAYVIRGVAAFQLYEQWEVGGTVGFGNTDSDVFPDGSGATDLDIYGKYYFGTSGDTKTEFAAGGVITVPTGDNTAGLGDDAFRLGAFGSFRHRMRKMILNGNVGIRANEDAEFSGLPELDGEVSLWAGFGVIIPRSDRFSIVAETRFESERYEFGDSLFDILGGINWRVNNRGQIRAAIDFGLDDGSPDFRFLAGYAASF